MSETAASSPTALAAIRTSGLSKRFRRRWSLRDCTIDVPAGRVAALIGPNGAGKTTLLRLAVGLIAPTSGTISVLGSKPGRQRSPNGVAFLAQEKPLYQRFRVSEMLRAAAVLNSGSDSRWDAAYACALIGEGGIPLSARIDTLSGGQRTRVALALTLGRRPELLLLDEPFADLDPLARRDMLRTVLRETRDAGRTVPHTVLLSSHVIGDLVEACDYVILLRDGRVWLSGAIPDLLAEHRLVSGPHSALATARSAVSVVSASSTADQHTLLVRGSVPAHPEVTSRSLDLEELVIAYLELPDPPADLDPPEIQ